jgi:hypothetical protein
VCMCDEGLLVEVLDRLFVNSSHFRKKIKFDTLTQLMLDTQPHASCSSKLMPTKMPIKANKSTIQPIQLSTRRTLYITVNTAHTVLLVL